MWYLIENANSVVCKLIPIDKNDDDICENFGERGDDNYIL